MNYAKTVDELLEMYADYTTLLAEQKTMERTVARAKLAGEDDETAQEQLDQLGAKLQELSDAMTFDTPRIWIEYKYRAYRDEPQPIATMHDFRLHCSKPGYICTARYNFLTDAMAREGFVSLNDRQVYPDDMELSELLKLSLLDDLDEITYKTWRDEEYYRDAKGAVRKWHI